MATNWWQMCAQWKISGQRIIVSAGLVHVAKLKMMSPVDQWQCFIRFCQLEISAHWNSSEFFVAKRFLECAKWETRTKIWQNEKWKMRDEKWKTQNEKSNWLVGYRLVIVKRGTGATTNDNCHHYLRYISIYKHRDREREKERLFIHLDGGWRLAFFKYLI